MALSLEEVKKNNQSIKTVINSDYPKDRITRPWESFEEIKVTRTSAARNAVYKARATVRNNEEMILKQRMGEISFSSASPLQTFQTNNSSETSAEGLWGLLKNLF